MSFCLDLPNEELIPSRYYPDAAVSRWKCGEAQSALLAGCRFQFKSIIVLVSQRFIPRPAIQIWSINGETSTRKSHLGRE